MNSIPLLREIVSKLIPLLAEKDIKVSQQGINAYVNYNKVTGLPVSVNVPNIPDNADEKLVGAIMGFLDHEVGHLLHTDGEEYRDAFNEWTELGKDASQVSFLKSLHNTIEDVYVEKKQEEMFRGTKYNLDNVRDFLLEEHTTPSLEDGQNLVPKLLYAAIRAWGNQPKFVDYMDDKWTDIAAFAEKIPVELQERIGQCNSTADTRLLTRSFFDYVQSIDDENESQQDDSDDQDESSDENKSQEESQPSDGDEEDSEDVSCEDEKWQEGDSPISEFDDAVSDAITSYIKQLVNQESGNYLLYSTDEDDYSQYEGTQFSVQRHVNDAVDAIVGPMARNLERVLKVKGLERWSVGHRRGRLDRRSVSRLAVSNRHQELHTDSIYKQKEVNNTNDVAISILVDCSQSMRSDLKQAFYAAYGIAATLDRLSIPSELLGFTTKADTNALAYWDKVKKASTEDGLSYARHLPLYIPKFKSFTDRVGPKITNAIESFIDRSELGATVVGEPVEHVYHHLSKRPESGKLIIVVTDGRPECPSAVDMAEHAKKVISDVEQSKNVDIVGIGINVDVNDLFTDFVLIREVEELPSVLVNKLKTFIFKQATVR